MYTSVQIPVCEVFHAGDPHLVPAEFIAALSPTPRDEDFILRPLSDRSTRRPDGAVPLLVAVGAEGQWETEFQGCPQRGEERCQCPLQTHKAQHPSSDKLQIK